MNEPAFQLRLSRLYSASREEVFGALTRGPALERWFGPGPEYRTTVHELDPREGGSFRIEFNGPEGTNVLFGEYREVSAPVRLAFTWRWEDQPLERGLSLVLIELRDADGQTELQLTHRNLSADDSVELHRRGWTGALDRLPGFLEQVTK